MNIELFFPPLVIISQFIWSKGCGSWSTVTTKPLEKEQQRCESLSSVQECTQANLIVSSALVLNAVNINNLIKSISTKHVFFIIVLVNMVVA